MSTLTRKVERGRGSGQVAGPRGRRGCFGIPGIQLYGLVAALRDEPGIKMVTNRHEQASTFMAYGYACASGKPGVALVVPGVGVCNASGGLATAYSRSSPILLIAGQIPRGQMGKNLGGVHEIDNQMDIVQSITKWRQQALTPKEIPAAVSEAFRQMHTGRPRPTYIDSGYSFNLGYAFPTALGAKVAQADRTCTQAPLGPPPRRADLALAVALPARRRKRLSRIRTSRRRCEFRLA